ncbi:glutamate receptor 2.7-like [Impatiens glandulifera]|uniref:glutamate receptor 2.7-like n=1 Tax=Impatiens glandulifera TaxID=253017 RepID=UPI001FB1A0CA|nr:glutamate receptor 2.7-like [Impatiens glandulifera]
MFGCSSMVAAGVKVDVGVILDMETGAGEMGFRCISMAFSDYNAGAGAGDISLHVRDSKGTVLGASAAALDLLKNVQVQAIIGPPTSLQSDFVINMGENAHVPIVSFSTTSPFQSSLQSAYLVRATLSDSSQVEAIASLIRSFGWREVVQTPHSLDREDHQHFGPRAPPLVKASTAGIIPFLANALQDVDVRISHRSSIPPLASDNEILVVLYKLMTMQTRVFVVHMDPMLGFRLFNKAKEIGMMREGYVWITTNGITNTLSIINDSSNILETRSMHGVLGIKPHFPRTKRLKDFISRWKNESKFSDLNIYGLWAYDAATALAIAIQKVIDMNTTFDDRGRLNISTTTTSNNATLTDFENIGVSQMGRYINQELSKSRFRGLGGDFHLINGELQSSSSFQIVNFIDDLGERGVGFWTPKIGISKKLNGNHLVNNSNTKLLKDIIWPGESRSIPKGWVIPTNGKQLMIGVPVKVEKSDFLNLIIESDTNETKVTGYVIDVFDAVMAKLPYHVSYKYVPFATPDGKPMGDYNELVYQVSLGKYDAVVGDVTIVANRSLYVDFTLPFMDSGVTMFVPYKDKKNNNPLAFLKPLTWDLWVTSGCFFIFIGFVIWILEHKPNGDFGSSQSDNEGCTSFWSSFSTLFLAHREEVVSNLARLVVIIWGFLVLILTQSYTASLTSLMTVQQLEPSITDVQDLIIKGQSIGYPKGSFVFSYLKQMGCKDSQLKMFKSMKDLDSAFSNKSIVAAFDESPYLKQLVGRHCFKYTMIGPNLKTGGFGFGFPRGSPLVSDVSREILNVTEGGEMEKIENKWFGNEKSCPQQDPKAGSSNLSLGNFWGLFLIVGSASSIAVIIFLAMLTYEHRHFLMQCGIIRSFLMMIKSKEERKMNEEDTIVNIEDQIEENHMHYNELEILTPTSNIVTSPDTPFSPCRSSISEHYFE